MHRPEGNSDLHTVDVSAHARGQEIIPRENKRQIV